MSSRYHSILILLLVINMFHFSTSIVTMHPVIFSSVADGSSPLVIDHTTINISQIPQEWLIATQNTITVHYAHTSHGSQINAGLDFIEKRLVISVINVSTVGQ